MKTLTDIKNDMSELYENVKTGEIDLKLAAELANIAGKFLKAEQLDLATSIFISGQYKDNATLPRTSPTQPQLQALIGT